MAAPDEKQRETWQRQAQERRQRHVKAWLTDVFTNAPLLLGLLLVGGLLFVAMYAQDLAPRNPLEVRPVMTIDGQRTVPPYVPSDTFPLGSDPQGRDILSQILYGTRQTLLICALVVLARLVTGLLLGAIAGWYQDSRADRLIMSVGEFMSAFPVLILAIVLILLLDIRRGLPTFIIALGMVGWAEVAQYFRSEFIVIKEQPYIEGARVLGLSRLSTLFRHALPNVIPSLVALTALEMSAALLILGELGFLNIFIGSGTISTDISDRPTSYLDVPEWGGMLAGSWRFIRNKTWIPLYPAVAFFIAIFAFNLLGEGLRRLIERGRVPVHVFYSKHTFAIIAAIALTFMTVMNNVGPRADMMRVAFAFDEQRALASITELAGGDYGGRRTGSPEEQGAAEWIASQFQELGLKPMGDDDTYFQAFPVNYQELAATPTLVIEDKDNQPVLVGEHRGNFREIVGYNAGEGQAEHAEIVFIGGGRYDFKLKIDDMTNMNLQGRVLMTTGAGGIYEIAARAVEHGAVGILLPTPNETRTQMKGSYQNDEAEPRLPVFVISEEMADTILAPTGRHMQDLWTMEQRGDILPRFGTGSRASMSLELERHPATSHNVLGYWPGADPNYAWQTVVICGHYDHLGQDPDGTVFHGAYDNASGVAVGLEIARLWREQGFQPQRSVLFAAWGGEEQGLIGSYYFTQHPTSRLPLGNVTAVLNIDAVGRGYPNDLSITKPGVPEARVLYFLVQEAAQRMGVGTREPGYAGGSDHVPFMELSIPGVLVIQDGDLNALHMPSDTVANIQLNLLDEAGEVAALAAMMVSVGH
ncbi:MAG: M20/M25/M40 family metallo-hydrolase [Chloroflexi bacterium]|nr:M20/M25/M40 family metallo-hydrolase [Chloroflexota bacterium]MBU1746781.1 M20/M25/M40 family metallo-hydrolase [Chloroflexota bacterium]MBU1878164.1 M20/M25/M40 family metallo-hydrolase [Chloroflexota bacterium]